MESKLCAEAGSDLSDAQVGVFGTMRITEERAMCRFGEQSTACDRSGRIEIERLVFQVMGEVVELIGHLRDPGLGYPSPASDERGVIRPALDSRLTGRVVTCRKPW